MLRVALTLARPGMRLAFDLRHPDSGAILLTEGFELDTRTIQRLRDLSLHNIWVMYPHTKLIKQYVSPTIMQHHGRMVQQMAELFDRVHQDAHARLDYRTFRQTSRDLIESLVSEPKAASYLVELGGTGSNRLRHAAEVSFLSLLMGLKLGGYLVQERKRLRPRDARNVINLGVGAMMHDIGITRLNPEISNQYEQTRDQSDIRWQEHVRLGYEMVKASLGATAAGVVLHHHQYFDGSGFPVRTDANGEEKALAGHTIHVYARIACVADHFDQLRQPPKRMSLTRVRVLNLMMHSPLTVRFDPVILGALLHVVPAFPPGSMVTLNDEREAIVCGWHPEHPCQPEIRPLPRSDENKVVKYDELPIIDLSAQDQLSIIAHEGCYVDSDLFHVPGTVLRAMQNHAEPELATPSMV